MRARGAGSDPGQGLARPPRHRLRPLEVPGPAGRARSALLLVAIALAACRTGAGGAPPGSAGSPLAGLRILYEGRSEAPDETRRFRLAVAIAPPDRIRLEVLAPVGGPRLVVTADGHRLLALDPPHRRAEVWESESEGVLRLLGAAMGAAELRTLLEGRPPCALETVASESGCPFGDGRYRLERGGSDVRKVSLLDASGRPLVQLEYPMPQPEGADWWREIVLRRQGAPTLRLSLATGPVRSDLDPTLFSTVPPDKFERGQVLGGDGLSAAVEAAPSEP